MTLKKVFRNVLLLLLVSKFASARVSDPGFRNNYQSYRWNINNDPYVTDLYLDDHAHILWVKVKAPGREGVWNAVPANLTIVNTPQWWASAIACVLYGMMLLAFLYALYDHLLRPVKLKTNRRPEHGLQQQEETGILQANTEPSPDIPQEGNIHHDLFEKYTNKVSLNTSRASPVSADERLLKRVLEYVEERIDDSDLHIDEICDKIGLSRTQLYRKMKAMTDLSMAELIKQIRLQRARELLQARKFHINEVCYMVGFTNSDYFRKCFKAHFGLAPTAYTKQQLGKMNQEAEASRLMKITTSQGFDNSYSDRVSSLRR
ncbi:Helix-turn-helix domain-containing protein [Pedobacter westerhofensis]|uniref:Helix-turn-helix domain-containing protein n=1 Tax=Pedobacter westerhofensis TaxID=425512 RepID=A0A521BP32_9SPHI|nr:AraC family transcriptional regulator [Pedobacter westerhofensis]SMO48912.1 Helix-turn-helix domain-containing protein [Pedobacter westerhofensis]